VPLKCSAAARGLAVAATFTDAGKWRADAEAVQIDAVEGGGEALGRPVSLEHVDCRAPRHACEGGIQAAPPETVSGSGAELIVDAEEERRRSGIDRWPRTRPKPLEELLLALRSALVIASSWSFAPPARAWPKGPVRDLQKLFEVSQPDHRVKSLNASPDRAPSARGRRATKSSREVRRVAPPPVDAARRALFFSSTISSAPLRATSSPAAPRWIPPSARRWRELGIDVLQGYWGRPNALPPLTFNRVDLNRLGSVGTPLPGSRLKVAADGEVLARGPEHLQGLRENDEANARGPRQRTAGTQHRRSRRVRQGRASFGCAAARRDKIVLAEGTNVYPEDIENALAADPRHRGARDARCAQPSRRSLAPAAQARHPACRGCSW